MFFPFLERVVHIFKVFDIKGQNAVFQRNGTRRTLESVCFFDLIYAAASFRTLLIFYRYLGSIFLSLIFDHWHISFLITCRTLRPFIYLLPLHIKKVRIYRPPRRQLLLLHEQSKAARRPSMQVFVLIEFLVFGDYGGWFVVEGWLISEQILDPQVFLRFLFSWGLNFVTDFELGVIW